jgi:branched-chain amino acid transport system permease protein
MAHSEKSSRLERVDRGIKVRCDGVYAISSWREIAYLVAPRLFFVLFLLALPIMLIPVPYWQQVILHVCVYALIAVGFDFLANYVGLVSLGGAFYVGVGSYIAALLNTKLGFPPFLTIPLATVLGGAFCALVFLPCLPLRGVYFAIVSLMYPILAHRIIEALNIFGGTDGILGVQGFSSSWTEMYLLLCSVLVFVFLLRRLTDEDIGLVFRGIKDNDQAVKASGIGITKYKAFGVFITSALGCFAGAALTHINNGTGISMFALEYSILPIAATVVGGGGSLIGPVIGAFLLVPISEMLREFGTLRVTIYSLILTGFIVFKSEGIMNYITRKYEQFERWVEI